MSENTTYIDEAPEFLDDADDYVIDYEYYGNVEHRLRTIYYLLIIVTAFPSNILALAFLIRRRLWLRHEAYIYLAAILIANVTKSVLIYGDTCLRAFDVGLKLVTLSMSANVVCQLHGWLRIMNGYTELLYIPFLMNVCLRQQLKTSSDGRECFAKLAEKYCTLFGTKVVIGSLFTVCALFNFWSFSIYGLESYGSTYWRCAHSHRYSSYGRRLSYVSTWVGFISLFILIPLILLVIWKMRRGSGFVSNRMSGPLHDDSHVIARIVVCCATVSTILEAPATINFIIYLLSLQPFMGHKWSMVSFILSSVYIANPLSTPIICFAVKSSFRDDLKTIVGRCCSGFRCLRKFPLESEDNTGHSSVLQMGKMEEDSTITQQEGDSAPIIHQM